MHVLSSTLAEKPQLVCQVLLNTILNNFATRHGFSMLHASALVKDGHILVLQAPHGTGKSTTALRLLLNGYQLLSDSQIYLAEQDGELWMGGFPIGRIKLRTDMLPLFPALAAEAQAEPVRNETKHRVDLTRVDPALTRQEMIQVERVNFVCWSAGIDPKAKSNHYQKMSSGTRSWSTVCITIRSSCGMKIFAGSICCCVRRIYIVCASAPRKLRSSRQ